MRASRLFSRDLPGAYETGTITEAEERAGVTPGRRAVGVRTVSSDRLAFHAAAVAISALFIFAVAYPSIAGPSELLVRGKATSSDVKLAKSGVTPERPPPGSDSAPETKRLQPLEFVSGDGDFLAYVKAQGEDVDALLAAGGSLLTSPTERPREWTPQDIEALIEDDLSSDVD